MTFCAFSSPVKILGIVVVSAILCAFTVPQAESKILIGVAMPTNTVLRWISDGHYIKKELEARGYSVDLQTAQDDIPNQLAQIENMITKGAKILIIAPIDGTTLSDVLQKAADGGIKIIAYDRLINGSKNVDYYASFDNFQVGILQARSIEKALNLKTSSGPFHIELFAGSPDDNNTHFFYQGAMSVLEPYIKSGRLVVKSGQITLDKISTQGWLGDSAQARMDNLLSTYYTNSRLDAVLAANDTLAFGIISSLKFVGYGSKGQPFPVVTGQDAETPSVKSILHGEQYSTIFKDTRLLAKITANMVDALINCDPVPVNNTTSYHNKVKFIPSYLLQPVMVDKSNYQQILVDSFYLSADQLKK